MKGLWAGAALRMCVALLFLFGVGVTGSWGQAAVAGPQQAGPGAGERSTPISAVPQKRQQEQDETAEFRHSPMVQKMGRMVGMNPDQAATTFTVLNFLVLAAGVGWLAARTLPKAFRDRSSGIQRHLLEARTATEDAGSRLKAVESRLSKLDEEIAAMRRHVEADTAREEQRLRAALEEETAKIVSAADAEIQAATAAARRALQRHAADLAIERASRQLMISPETDRQLVQSFAEQLVREKGAQN